MGIRSISINLSRIPKDKIVTAKNGDKYINLDELDKRQPDEKGNDISIAIRQTKAERDAGDKKVFVGDGKWIFRDSPATSSSSDTVSSASRDDQSNANDDLPF